MKLSAVCGLSFKRQGGPLAGNCFQTIISSSVQYPAMGVAIFTAESNSQPVTD